jgi:hypothetical protein
MRILETEENSSLITEDAACEIHKKYTTFCGWGNAIYMGMTA